jgi:hypothetical protein
MPTSSGPAGIDPHHLTAGLEVPRQHRPAAEAATQTGVVEKLPRVLGPATAIEVGGSGGGRETLNTGTDRHRDHVLLQPLVVANTRVAPGGEHVAIPGTSSVAHLRENLAAAQLHLPGDAGMALDGIAASAGAD